ncbi:Transcription repressor [Abeliophyllum distichum]|uniref:Transcription repressor n=1 Tax=Abeliophyllum distichum TaxID=126358 RepID=A0ABD1TVY5_9LAMI
MEINHFINTVSRIFPSSFTSCQFRTLPDAIEPSINNPKTSQNLHENDLFSFNKPPKSNKIILKNDFKNSKRTTLLGSSPASGTEGKRLNFKGKDREISKNVITHSSSSNSTGWFTDEKTEADAETNTFFSLSTAGSCESFTESSRRKCDINSINALGHTVLSDQYSRKTKQSSRKTVQNPVKSASNGKKTSKKSRKNELMGPKKIVPEGGFEVCDFSTELYYSNSGSSHRKTRKITNPRRRTTNSLLPVDNWIDESYAMEKRSKDPHSDFRASMVEMIVEKQIFGSNDLERLLHCFLSLNEASYHGIIFDVFTEICETLFSN